MRRVFRSASAQTAKLPASQTYRAEQRQEMPGPGTRGRKLCRTVVLKLCQAVNIPGWRHVRVAFTMLESVLATSSRNMWRSSRN